MKNKKRLLLIALVGLLTTSCKDNYYEEDLENNTVIEETLTEEDTESDENIEEDINIGDIEIEKEPLINVIKVVTANKKTKILDEDNNLLGYLPNNHSLDLKKIKNSDGFYEVKYYDKKAYVLADDVDENVRYEINRDIKKVVYAKEDIYLEPLPYISDELICIPKNEVLEVYSEDYDEYFVQTNEYIGYIKQDKVEELEGTFVVVDISDQNLKLYENNQITLNTPIVSGKGANHSDEGVFEIFKIRTNCYLIGPTWRSYVNFMLNYNHGEGLHDAEKWVDENGFKHGWREPYEFGGDTYIKDGSHGCINMLHEAAEEIYNKTSYKTRVIVKK